MTRTAVCCLVCCFATNILHVTSRTPLGAIVAEDCFPPCVRFPMLEWCILFYFLLAVSLWVLCFPIAPLIYRQSCLRYHSVPLLFGVCFMIYRAQKSYNYMYVLLVFFTVFFPFLVSPFHLFSCFDHDH